MDNRDGVGLPEQCAAVEAMVERMRLRANHPPGPFWTLTGLLHAWGALSDQIAQGYSNDIYEYTNDLSVRDLLEELLRTVPDGELGVRLRNEIAAIDERYRATTHPVNEPIAGRDEMPWWWYRVPNTLIGELVHDLGPDGRC